jgi:hypothetical protein
MKEPTNWKGVRWCDLVQASNLSEEIARHFGHECEKAGCGENEDETTCEMDWLETKLIDWLTDMATARILEEAEAGIAASVLGRIGGASKSAKKQAASRKNGKKHKGKESSTT